MSSIAQHQERSRLSKPQVDWWPLARAVVGLRLPTDDQLDAALRASATDAAEINDASEEQGGPTLEQLAHILQEQAGALNATIDPETGTFTLRFYDSGSGASVYGGAPWELLKEPGFVESDPRRDAEALFRKDGFVTTSRESAAFEVARFDKVRRAVGLVWRQYLLRDFDCAVVAGHIALFARVGDLRTDFQALAKDVWPLLTVLDWTLGIAQDPDGACYYSIHARRVRTVNSIAGDETAVAKALAAQLRVDPDMKRDNAFAWCEKNGRISERGFKSRIWPKARALAGLSEKGASGRKRKSAH